MPATTEVKAGAASAALAGAFSMTLLASGGLVLLSLLTGVLTARMLGTDGRGQVAAISAWLMTLSWGASLGFADAMTYQLSKRRITSATIVTTTLLSIPVLGGVGVLLAQVLVPLGFSAQSAETQQLARTVLCAIPAVLGLNSVWALLLGRQNFGYVSIIRVAQPLLYAVGLLVLVAADAFTVAWVLTLQVASYVVVLLVVGCLLLVQEGAARPSLALTRTGLNYGLRLQGVAFGQLMTLRLDQLMIPAFLTAAAVGQYSVAVGVATMVPILFGSLQMVVFPMAARSTTAEAALVVERGVRVTLFGGAATVVLLGIAAPVLVPFVYGQEFSPAVTPLWLLLPGVVLWAAQSILGSGLQSANRPGTASIIQLLAMVVTVLGLVVTLPRFGMVGAALTSSVAYAFAFTASLVVSRSTVGISLRRCLAPSAAWSDLVHVVEMVRQRLAPKRRPVTGEDT